MNITTTRKVVKNPEAYSDTELHEALDVLVSDERFTEAQVTKGQAAIEAELNSRKGVYPEGTNIRNIKSFNRGIKVMFHCVEHPQYDYMSKDPFCSQMFPANEAAQRASFGIDKDECNHKLRDDVWVTSSVYNVNS